VSWEDKVREYKRCAGMETTVAWASFSWSVPAR
jgi:hypothetical protein